MKHVRMRTKDMAKEIVSGIKVMNKNISIIKRYKNSKDENEKKFLKELIKKVDKEPPQKIEVPFISISPLPPS
jgi:hypothetical protein